MIQGSEIMQIPSWSTPQVEDGISAFSLDRFQERFIVLTDIVISRAIPEISCQSVIMPNSNFEIRLNRKLWRTVDISLESSSDSIVALTALLEKERSTP